MTFVRTLDGPPALAAMHAEHLARRARMAGSPTLPAALAPQLPPPFKVPRATIEIPPAISAPVVAPLTLGDIARLAVVERRRRHDEMLARAPALKGGHKPTRAPVTTLQEILVAVCTYYGVSAHDVKSERRTFGIVLPRQIIAWLGKSLTLRSLPEVGRFLNRDHTTILHACRKIEAAMQVDGHLSDDLDALADALRQDA